VASGFTADESGAVLTSEQVEQMLVEPLMAQAVVLRSEPRVFTGRGVPIRVPKIAALELNDPWRSENMLISESDPTYGELELLPGSLKSLKVIHRVSNELARHSVAVVAELLSDALTARVALAVDRAMLIGDGANSTILGIANQTGVQVMPAVGMPTVDDLHDAVGLAMAANATPTVWWMTPRDLVTLRKAKDPGGAYLVHPDPTQPGVYQLLGIPVRVSNQMPTQGGVGGNESTIVLADASQVAVGIDQDVSVTLLPERYADFDQLGIRVTARFDVGLLNAEGVVVLRGVTP